MREICQDRLPVTPWMDDKTNRLPGLIALKGEDWLRVDEAYAAQMAYRCDLIANRQLEVFRMSALAKSAAQELLDLVLAEISEIGGFEVGSKVVRCPDGRQVEIDHNTPLIICGQLVQEDFAIMQEQDGAHRLTGAILCFPASWSLDEKFMGSLRAIHSPVPKYDDNIARRVQRVFDGIQVGRAMWRANHLVYSNPDLFQPRREDDRRIVELGAPKWMRVERQCLRKLPVSGAVIFSIHSYVVPFENLSKESLKNLVGA